jgi:hypothetical protein
MANHRQKHFPLPGSIIGALLCPRIDPRLAWIVPNVKLDLFNAIINVTVFILHLLAHCH